MRWMGWRGGLKILGGLVLLLLLLTLAWLASNNRFVDSAPVPVPEALRLRPVSLAPERNSFYAFQALSVPVGQDPAAEGRKRWGHGDELPPPSGPSLKWPSEKLWNCSGDLVACTAGWRADPQALSALLNETAELGARCEALTAPGLGFEELLPEPATELKKTTDQYAGRALPLFQNHSYCMRWLHAKAVLAQTRRDAAASERALQQADTLLQNLLTGSRSLVSHMVAWSMAQRHFHMLTLMAAAEPAEAARYAAQLHELPAIVREPAPWVPYEANFSRVVMHELALGCELADSSAPLGTQGELRCSRSLLLMPEASTQLQDGLWLQVLERGREGGPLALPGWSPRLEEGRFFGHTWRNSLGHVLSDVASVAYESYFEAQADVLLIHAAAGLALRAAADRPADPAAWLAAQGLDPRLLARLRIDPKTGALLAERWRAQAGQPAELAFPIPKTSLPQEA